VRYSISLLSAALINLGLFLLMAFMAVGQQNALRGGEEITMVDFVRLKRETEPPQPKERRLPEKPPPPEEPLPMAMPRPQAPQPKTPAVPKIVPNIESSLALRNTGPYLGDYAESAGTIEGPAIAGEGDVIPLVRVPPQYPQRAARRGIEGVVTVSFIITKEGSVRDPEVVEAHPPGMFEQAALHAIQRWRFKPKRTEGQLVEQRATQEIEFKLTK
jgi:periplasmic protein TonB